MSHLQPFFEILIPLLVAIDPLGLIPLLIGFTASMEERRRRRIILEAVSVGFLITLGFMFLGHATFRFLGISEHDFRIAGGLLLLVLAVLDLVQTGKSGGGAGAEQLDGIVPLAMPLIAGPATLTTVLVFATNPRYGYGLTMLAVVVAFGVLHGAMLASGWIARRLGRGALRALSKLVMVLLAAIAVNFIRTGVAGVMGGAGK